MAARRSRTTAYYGVVRSVFDAGSSSWRGTCTIRKEDDKEGQKRKREERQLPEEGEGSRDCAWAALPRAYSLAIGLRRSPWENHADILDTDRQQD